MNKRNIGINHFHWLMCICDFEYSSKTGILYERVWAFWFLEILLSEFIQSCLTLQSHGLYGQNTGEILLDLPKKWFMISKPEKWYQYNPQSLFRFNQFLMNSCVCVLIFITLYIYVTPQSRYGTVSALQGSLMLSRCNSTHPFNFLELSF